MGAVVGMRTETVERLVLEQCRLAERLPERYAQLRRLGIDEQSHRKGKKNWLFDNFNRAWSKAAAEVFPKCL